jgi:general secretion pathway protein L
VRETLYLRLGASPEADCEYGIAGADLRSLRTQRGPLEQATERSLVTGRRVVVFVPAADVRMALVKVPARQPSKVLQAVPYALEDQLAEDVDSLHFAIGPRQADGAHPVAIASRARIARELALLRHRGVQPDVLVPETLALPVDAEGANWSALLDQGQVCVRNGAWNGFTCAVEDLDAYLSLADPERTHGLRLHLCGDTAFDASTLDRPVTLLPEPSALFALATHHAAERSINLLQGAYAPSRDLDLVWKPWRLTAALLLGWLALLGTGYAIDALRLGAELARQDQANIARFQQLFPEQTRVVDLSAQLDQQLRALAAGGAGGGPLALLEPLTQALAANPQLKLTGMQYRENALFLSMTAPDLQVLEGLRNGFAARSDARLEVQSANAEGGAVQIRARMTRS